MGDMAGDFRALKAWNKRRDSDRRISAELLLKENNIAFSIPSLGCYKIESDRQRTIMFYPKSVSI